MKSLPAVACLAACTILLTGCVVAPPHGAYHAYPPRHVVVPPPIVHVVPAYPRRGYGWPGHPRRGWGGHPPHPGWHRGR
jgi:hypothetical protein